MDLKPGDVAARGNFCTLDADGNILDRRAGRIPSEESAPLVKRLQGIKIPEVDVDVRQVKEYRIAIVMRGEGLNPNLDDTDPQKTGVPPKPVRAREPEAKYTAELFEQWVAGARKVLADQPKANGVTLRGFATDPALISCKDAYGLDAACIAGYPMYRGVSKLVGMDVIQFEGESPEYEFIAAKDNWDEYDFFFIHIKKVDSRGEDGDFEAKAQVIESVDSALPILLDLQPEVLIITGDHSTPSLLRSHTWHPVPFLLWAPSSVLPDHETHFGERACVRGALGTFPALDTMPLALAHAGRLKKFGA
jgi:2,3-bisphosphoglycerate-independent phosphoglycerate mutase